MSDAYRCDDCGEVKDGTPAASIDTTLLRGDVDLCLPCVRKFKTRYKTDR